MLLRPGVVTRRAGFLAVLAVLEGGLRLAGWGWSRTRETRFEEQALAQDYDHSFERYRPRGREAPLVLALGDSLTNGTNVGSRQTYPHHLFRRFAEAGRPAAVYNLGYCEEGTSGVAVGHGLFQRSYDRLAQESG